MTLHDNIKRLDTLKPWFVFRSAVTGKYVSRLYALRNPSLTVRERRRKNR